MYMKNELMAHFGSDFPVGSGSTTEDDPLIITALRDYVAIEYKIAQHLLSEMGFEYKFEKQSCLNIDGKVVDELTYTIRKPSDPEKAGKMSFYFDVTRGFNQLSAPSPPTEPARARTPDPRKSETGMNWARDQRKVVQLWVLAAKSGKIPTREIASAVYFGLTDSTPPPEVRQITHPMDLLEYLKRKETGTGFTLEQQRETIAAIADASQPGQTPNPVILRLLMWAPNIAIILAIVAVFAVSFSWIVLGLAVFAKVENGFARFLAGRGHQAARLHVGLAFIAIPSSLVVSLLHIFSSYRFL